jgi:hypothetical protein
MSHYPGKDRSACRCARCIGGPGSVGFDSANRLAVTLDAHERGDIIRNEREFFSYLWNTVVSVQTAKSLFSAGVGA